MSAAPFPSFEQFPQGMDFLKQFWAQAAPPSPAMSAEAQQASPAFQQAMGQYLMPTFDLETLDKRITDLRTVLQFMDMNTNMLRQSLNALEVQRNTVATLQSMAQPKAGNAADASVASPWMAAWQSMVQTATQSATQTASPAASRAAPKAATSKKATVKKAAPKTTKSTKATKSAKSTKTV
jgi:hypothetical protein